jgi:hypothetical protein
MQLKNFNTWLNESAEMIDFASAISGENFTITYSKPVAIISKSDKYGKQNAIDVKGPSGKVNTYKIVGSVPFAGDTDINFKYIKKEQNGDFIFGRYVKGGIDDETISYSKVVPLLNNLVSGVKEYSPVMGITFYKI